MIQKSSNSPNTFPISINVVLNSRLLQKKKIKNKKGVRPGRLFFRLFCLVYVARITRNKGDEKRRNYHV